ncbi:glycosyltransferase family 8 protein [Parathielavia appendiculata]|uniref:Glycosyltransferase family 8 protein n=1 Tax=Parathielavia appendiculata TaxID=2587402 RepID=A0AAN6TPD1_9PEZI|nr:glycosyltransferase family 8 protein [Parathielavia appendiculata]
MGSQLLATLSQANDSVPPMRRRPGIADILSSRKIRLWLPVSLFLLVLLASSRRYDALPSIQAGLNCQSHQPAAAAATTTRGYQGTVDWSRFAYIQYVTNRGCLCNDLGKEELKLLAVFNAAKYLHLLDFPVPKPWLPVEVNVMLEAQPKCRVRQGVERCLERDLWNGLHADFRDRREGPGVRGGRC